MRTPTEKLGVKTASLYAHVHKGRLVSALNERKTAHLAAIEGKEGVGGKLPYVSAPLQYPF